MISRFGQVIRSLCFFSREKKKPDHEEPLRFKKRTAMCKEVQHLFSDHIILNLKNPLES